MKSEPDVWSIDQQKTVALENIKKHKSLKHLSLIKKSRLSVMPIDSKSWKALNKMSSI